MYLTALLSGSSCPWAEFRVQVLYLGYFSVFFFFKLLLLSRICCLYYEGEPRGLCFMFEWQGDRL